jgi:hypothetical protein
MVKCPISGCDGVLRQVDGVHSAGDAPLITDGLTGAETVLCPKCRNFIAWPLPTPDTSRIWHRFGHVAP